MTNEELLQQAKDQVAKEAKYANWEHLHDSVWHDQHDMKMHTDAAALLAIQSAREEGREEGIKGGEATGYDAGYSKGYEQGYESGQADLKSGFDIKKLTAPGR